MTIQNLIGSGMDPKTENNPYLGFIYTSFQVCSCHLLSLKAPWPLAVVLHSIKVKPSLDVLS